MKLYQVEYPFAVDEVTGRRTVVYPTMRAARAGATGCFRARAKAEVEGYSPEHVRATKNPAPVSVLTVRRLLPAGVSEIVNGGRWSEGPATPVARFVWTGRKIATQRLDPAAVLAGVGDAATDDADRPLARPVKVDV